jgi:NAD(P)H-dependent flavin oxidoreductase YrpB (nitropropane dioxygenase family)/DNA-binding MarR family transcriptional regulator
LEKIREINDTLVGLFNMVLKLEEGALKESSFADLTITEIHTLEAITLDKTKTMTQVARNLGISVSTLTAAINKLVQKGYVHRFRVEEDRRKVKIQLTDSGKEAVKEHEVFHLEMVSEALSTMNTEGVKAFADSISGMFEFLWIKKSHSEYGVYPNIFKPLDLNGLIFPLPILQGAMGIGFSLHGLASQVAMQGGGGVIASTEIGFREPDYDTNPLGANLRALEGELNLALDKVKDYPKRGPIGVNILASTKNYEAYVKAAIRGGAEFIVSGGGLPLSLPGLVKGSNVKLIPVVSSLRAAKILLKSWSKKYNRYPDAFILEGPGAGAHLGFRMSELEEQRGGFYSTIGALKSELRMYPSIKLIVAGGIDTKEDCSKALSCGADGIQIGTRLILTQECDISPLTKAAYMAAKNSDITLLDSPLGIPARVLNNELVKALQNGEKFPIDCDNCFTNCQGKDSSFCIKEALLETAKGNTRDGLLYIGSKGGNRKTLESLADVFKEFLSGN